MIKIHLSIEKVAPASFLDEALRTAFFFVVFIAGVLLGLGISFSLSSSFHLGRINSSDFVAAVGAVNTDRSTFTPPAAETPAISFDFTKTNSSSIGTAPLSNIISVDNTSEIRNINLIINDKEIAVTRLNQELERIKNESVTLIASFEQNCGSWNDPCAIPFSSKLESNNAAYNEGSKTLAQVDSELSAAKAELASLFR